MKMFLFLSSVVLLLSACSLKQAAQHQAQIPVEIHEEKNENLFSIPSLELQIRTSKQLRSDSNFSVIDTHTGKTAFHFELAPYLKDEDVDEFSVPDGWTLHRTTIEKLLQSQNCTVLQKNVLGSLPVSLGIETPFLCKIRKRSDEWTEVMIVGFQSYINGLGGPGSALIILRKDDGIIFSGIADFPLLEEARNLLTSEFQTQNPKIDLWSPQDPLWQIFNNHRYSLVKKDIEEPSLEMKQAMESLRAFGDSISFTTKP